MKVLLSGFDPFGGDRVNAAQLAVEGCRAPEGIELYKLIVPTVFGLAAEKVAEEAQRLRPDAIICVGEAGGRKAVTPERVGINIMDARIPDNEGNQPIDEKIAADGPDAYFSTLPVKAMVQRMRDAGYDAELSNSAGTFVCNSLMYGVLHYVNTRYPNEKGRPLAGFIHVPAERPAENADGSVTPIPRTSAEALGEALKALVK